MFVYGLGEDPKFDLKDRFAYWKYLERNIYGID